MSSSSPTHKEWNVPFNDYLRTIFLVPRKKKYTAHLINKDGTFVDKFSENNNIKVLRKLDDCSINVRNDDKDLTL